MDQDHVILLTHRFFSSVEGTQTSHVAELVNTPTITKVTTTHRWAAEGSAKDLMHIRVCYVHTYGNSFKEQVKVPIDYRHLPSDGVLEDKNSVPLIKQNCHWQIAIPFGAICQCHPAKPFTSISTTTTWWFCDLIIFVNIPCFAKVLC